jgi:hypothetical protein
MVLLNLSWLLYVPAKVTISSGGLSTKIPNESQEINQEEEWRKVYVIFQKISSDRENFQ